jgi:toxin ParE1/3/4
VNFRILPVADLEAVEAAVWYDDQRAGLGDQFLSELEAAFHKIRDSAQACSLLECHSGPHEVRRCLLRRFPYLAISFHRPEETVIIAVSHVRRRPSYWLDRIE